MVAVKKIQHMLLSLNTCKSVVILLYNSRFAEANFAVTVILRRATISQDWLLVRQTIVLAVCSGEAASRVAEETYVGVTISTTKVTSVCCLWFVGVDTLLSVSMLICHCIHLWEKANCDLKTFLQQNGNQIICNSAQDRNCA